MPTNIILWAEPKKFVLLDNANAVSVEGVADLEGRYGTLALQITGTFTATVSFKATVDGVNWEDIQGTKITDGVDAVSTSAAGIFTFKVPGISKVKAVISEYTSGTVSARATAVPLV